MLKFSLDYSLYSRLIWFLEILASLGIDLKTYKFIFKLVQTFEGFEIHNEHD